MRAWGGGRLVLTMILAIPAAAESIDVRGAGLGAGEMPERLRQHDQRKALADELHGCSVARRARLAGSVRSSIQ